MFFKRFGIVDCSVKINCFLNFVWMILNRSFFPFVLKNKLFFQLQNDLSRQLIHRSFCYERHQCQKKWVRSLKYCSFKIKRSSICLKKKNPQNLFLPHFQIFFNHAYHFFKAWNQDCYNIIFLSSKAYCFCINSYTRYQKFT